MDIAEILNDNSQKITDLVKNKLPDEFFSMHLIDKSVEMLCLEYGDLAQYYKNKKYEEKIVAEFEKYIFEHSQQLGIVNSLRSKLPDYLGGICEINEWKKVN